MWVYALLLSALCGGVLGNICETPFFRACSKLLEEQPAFPKTAEDLEELCPKIMEHFECAEDYFEKCGFPDEIDDAESLPKMKSYVMNVCKEDSLIRADIVKELPCMKQVVGELNYTCHDLSRDAMLNYMEENDIDYRSDAGQQFYCFYSTARLACMAAEFDAKCGAAARDIVLDAHLRTGYLDDDCDKDETDNVMQMVALLEIELAQKERIGSILSTYNGLGL